MTAIQTTPAKTIGKFDFQISELSDNKADPRPAIATWGVNAYSHNHYLSKGDFDDQQDS
jgi:hypothetical protein